MAYTNNIPQATDDPSQSQSQILNNFTSIDTVNSVNHVAYNDANQGKHKFLQMPEQGSVPTTAANEGGLFTKETIALITGLYFRRESDGTQLQLTDIDLTTSTVVSGTQYTFLSPWGFRITFGKTGTISNNGAVTFTTNFSASPYTLQVTAVDTNQSNVTVKSLSVSGSGFTVLTSTASIDQIQYFAIGPA